MTGMKEGAGDDPFADDDSGDDTPDTAIESESREGTTDDTQQPAETNTSPSRVAQIPYKFRRDGVQDGRDRVPLFLHEETKRAERDAVRELEERLDDDVSLTDLREALVKAGLAHLDDVEKTLEEWGYGLTFDE